MLAATIAGTSHGNQSLKGRNSAKEARCLPPGEDRAAETLLICGGGGGSTTLISRPSRDIFERARSLLRLRLGVMTPNLKERIELFHDIVSSRSEGNQKMNQSSFFPLFFFGGIPREEAN